MTSLSALLTLQNTAILSRLPSLQQQELSQLNAVFERVIKSVRNRQAQMEEDVKLKFNRLTQFINKERSRIENKRDVIERNYKLLERALDVVPL